MRIQAAGICKEFGQTPALRGVSLDVRPGELMALLGPSGSGKTTLLRVIAGLEVPDGGQVLFAGEDATSLPVQHRQVGFVFQHYALFKHLTVFDNIAYGLRARPRARRPRGRDIRKRVLALLDLVQLTGYEGRFPAQLSGGQRQRVALARALAVEPRVLLLDEPFGALDAKVRKDLRRWLREIHDQTGQTTIFVTHDQDEAIELADRVAILNHGRIEQVGTPDEVQDEPCSAFVMNFIGDVARFPARLRNGQATIGGKPVPVEAAGGVDRDVDLYCRPWDLRLAPAEDASIFGTIQTIRRVGGVRRADVRWDANGSVEVEIPLGLRLSAGDRVGLAITRARIFGPEAPVG